MGVTHTRPTVGSKRCGYDQRAYRKDGQRYSNLVTHKAPPTALAGAMGQVQALVDYSPFAPDCIFRAVCQGELDKGEQGLISHYGSEALALKSLEKYYRLAQEASGKERTKRQREKRRKVEQRERRKPLNHTPFRGIV